MCLFTDEVLNLKAFDVLLETMCFASLIASVPFTTCFTIYTSMQHKALLLIPFFMPRPDITFLYTVLKTIFT